MSINLGPPSRAPARLAHAPRRCPVHLVPSGGGDAGIVEGLQHPLGQMSASQSRHIPVGTASHRRPRHRRLGLILPRRRAHQRLGRLLEGARPFEHLGRRVGGGVPEQTASRGRLLHVVLGPRHRQGHERLGVRRHGAAAHVHPPAVRLHRQRTRHVLVRLAAQTASAVLGHHVRHAVAHHHGRRGVVLILHHLSHRVHVQAGIRGWSRHRDRAPRSLSRGSLSLPLPRLRARVLARGVTPSHGPAAQAAAAARGRTAVDAPGGCPRLRNRTGGTLQRAAKRVGGGRDAHKGGVLGERGGDGVVRGLARAPAVQPLLGRRVDDGGDGHAARPRRREEDVGAVLDGASLVPERRSLGAPRGASLLVHPPQRRVVLSTLRAAGVTRPGQLGGSAAGVGGGGGVGTGRVRAVLGVVLGVGALTLRPGGINPGVARRGPLVILHVVRCVRRVDVARRVSRRGDVGIGHVGNLTR
mmetsp:Transcript_168/g.634  ORF Transcript_168/g.634 Transcript_168/m.634 type:complete len:470 (-) Transcript_168:165-1574(-)